MAITYSKPVLSLKEFLDESGYPREFVLRALHRKDSDVYSFRSSDKPNAKFFIITSEFEHYRRIGEFK